jgi:hypothetical protein
MTDGPERRRPEHKRDTVLTDIDFGQIGAKRGPSSAGEYP